MSDDDKMTQEDYEFYSHRQLVETVMANAEALEKLREQLDRANEIIPELADLLERSVADSPTVTHALNRASDHLNDAGNPQLDRATEPRQCPGRYMADDGDGETQEFGSLDGARSWADIQVDRYRKDANFDGEWSGCVEDVAVWAVVERTREVKSENSSDFVLEPCAEADKPRPMSEAPRVWVGSETHITADVWKFGWTPKGHRWMGAHHRLSTGMIFVPMQYARPTVDPAEVDSLDTCRTVDWLPTSSGGGDSDV